MNLYWFNATPFEMLYGSYLNAKSRNVRLLFKRDPKWKLCHHPDVTWLQVEVLSSHHSSVKIWHYYKCYFATACAYHIYTSNKQNQPPQAIHSGRSSVLPDLSICFNVLPKTNWIVKFYSQSHRYIPLWMYTCIISINVLKTKITTSPYNASEHQSSCCSRVLPLENGQNNVCRILCCHSAFNLWPFIYKLA